LVNKFAKYYDTRPYVYGDIVKYKGKFYKARYGNKNKDPESTNAWTFMKKKGDNNKFRKWKKETFY